MSVWSQLLSRLGGSQEPNSLGNSAMKLLTGKTFDEHYNTEEPRNLAFGEGSAHHASAAEGAGERMGFLPSQVAGTGVELLEAMGNPQGSFWENLTSEDTMQDMKANFVGGLRGAGRRYGIGGPPVAPQAPADFGPVEPWKR